MWVRGGGWFGSDYKEVFPARGQITMDSGVMQRKRKSVAKRNSIIEGQSARPEGRSLAQDKLKYGEGVQVLLKPIQIF